MRQCRKYRQHPNLCNPIRLCGDCLLLVSIQKAIEAGASLEIQHPLVNVIRVHARQPVRLDDGVENSHKRTVARAIGKRHARLKLHAHIACNAIHACILNHFGRAQSVRVILHAVVVGQNDCADGQALKKKGGEGKIHEGKK